MNTSREIFLMAGETSGDERGAELIRGLKRSDPSLRFSGMGGARMREEGMEILADVSDLAVVGIIEVLKHYSLFKRTMDELVAAIEARQPAAVIGVDFPGFNLRLLRRLGSNGNSTCTRPRRIQYVSPQLWAWNEARKWKMAKYLDLVLCIFPFEPAYYEETDLKAIFIGHPLGGTVVGSWEKRTPGLVGLFPGSREKEIRAHMPIMSALEQKWRLSRKEVEFAYAASSPKAAALIRSFSPQCRIESAISLQSQAQAAIVCSGTATLEAALAGLPICVIYRVAWPTYWMGRALIKTPHLAMPNLLARRELVREFIQSDLTVENLSMELERLLKNETHRDGILTGYTSLRSDLGNGDAATTAAAAILQMLEPNASIPAGRGR